MKFSQTPLYECEIGTESVTVFYCVDSQENAYTNFLVKSGIMILDLSDEQFDNLREIMRCYDTTFNPYDTLPWRDRIRILLKGR